MGKYVCSCGAKIKSKDMCRVHLIDFPHHFISQPLYIFRIIDRLLEVRFVDFITFCALIIINLLFLKHSNFSNLEQFIEIVCVLFIFGRYYRG